MPKNWVNPNKQLQERTQRENEKIRRERERQQKIQQGKKQGWVNPNLYTPRERMDRYLESQGMLNYQRRAQPQTISNPHLVPSGGNADRPQNFAQGVDPATGKAVTAPVATNAQSQYAPMVFAKPEQVQKGEANWSDLSTTDRKNILSDPNFYKGNKITQYSPAVQQQILADPSFNWDQLPNLKIAGIDTGFNWQRAYYSLSSNPAAMGAVQGTVMAAGNPMGAVLGTAMGWSAGVLGYDPNKEFWKQGDNKLTADMNQATEFARGAFGLLNWGAENVEKGLGVLVKSASILTGNDPNFDPNKRNLDIQFNKDFSLIPGKNFNPNLITGSTWEAGLGTFEALAPSLTQMMQKNGAAQLSPAVAIYDMFTNPEKYKGTEYYLGAANAEQLKTTFYERMQQAEDRIKAGEDYRTVANEMQAGIIAQAGDMVGQGVADPLNYAGLAETVVGKVTADITGDKIASQAFTQSMTGESPGYMDAQSRLKNIVNTPGEAIKIDPNYKVQELGSMSKFITGLNSEGQIKAGKFTNQGLLDYTPPKKNLLGFIEYLANQTPESRARVGQDLLVSNVGRIMASYFNGTDVEGFANWWKAFSNGDTTQAADLSRAMANSPEFYTVLPAAQGFDMDAAVTKWTATADARDAVTRIADALGENPMSMIEDMAKRGTAEQDLTRLRERVSQLDTPEARAILKDIDEGRLTSSVLQDTVKLFSNGDVPYHPGQWMAQTLHDIQSHYDNWAVDHFKLDAEAKKTLFRMSAVLKSAQSVLLLGANPGYMISNVLPTMVTRAMSGVWGYMTPGAIDNFLTRMGFAPDAGLMPNRLDEGVGPGGLVDQARGQGDVIREATRGNGVFTKIEDTIGKFGRNMPFNKLSRILEGYEGKQAYMIGMKKFWGEAWRRGKAFRELPSGLVTELQNVAGPRAADILYSAIEAGMNKTEIQNIVSSASQQVQSRTLVNDAAARLNIPSAKAASLLEQAGVFDALDASLKNANSEAKIRRAFERASDTARTSLFQQAARDAVANIEHVAQKLSTEGMKAVTDVILDTEDAGIEQWLQHYERMGEVADAMDSLDNPQTRSNLWSLKYAESSAEFRQHNAHKASVYLGVLKALGEDANPNGRALLANLAETDAALDSAYRTMRQLRDEHFSKWNNDWENPRRQVERTNVERQIEQAWKKATDTEISNSRKFGELLGNQYENLFGVEAGEAARQAWEQITAFRKEMTDRRDAFRRSIEGLPNAERQIQSKKFWGETYKYMIAEMQRIKTEAINNLDAIANKRKPGGDATGPLSPNDPTPNLPPDEMARLRQQAEERIAAREAKINAVWEVASNYGFSSENTSGLYGLLGALKTEEYGGDPTFTGGLKEATDRWMPDEIDAILEKRRQAKDAQDVSRVASRNMEYQSYLQNKLQGIGKRMVDENTGLLEAIKRHGGLDWKYVEEVTGDKKPPINQRNIFSKTGKNRWGLDEMARILADDGFPIDMNNPNDLGGIAQTVDLIRRAQQGESIFPMGSTRGEALLDATIAKAQAEYIDNITMQDAFNPARWEADFMDAVETMDFTRLSDLIEQLPPDIADQPYSVTGETYNEFASRTWDETATRLQEQQHTAQIADNTARAEKAIKDVQAEAELGMTRSKFRESLTEVFRLSDEEADAVMDITDARANTYGNAAEWYKTRIADVQEAGKVDLAQESNDILQNIKERGYATAEEAKILRDQGLLRDIQDPLNKKQRKQVDEAVKKSNGGYRAVLDKANAGLPLTIKEAEGYSTGVPDGYIKVGDMYEKVQPAQVRNPKAGVRFLEDGRAIIRAWEGKADVSSIVHEIGHIFRRDLQGSDLRIIEQWAEVKNGEWTRAAEEKFARGWERYLADGSAPTPKLRRVFEQFKTWMTSIYRAITGSPIDIDLTPQVKEVFDRLLTGQEQPRSIDVNEQLFQMGYDPKAYYLDAQGNIKRRGELNIRVDKAGVAQEADAILSTDFAKKLAEAKRTTRPSESVDPNVPARRAPTSQLTYDEFKANAFTEQKARAEQMLDRLNKIEAGQLPEDDVPELMHNSLKLVRDEDGYSRYKSTPTTIDEVRAKYAELRDRNTISYELYGNLKERWMSAVEQALINDQPVPEQVKQAYYDMKRTSGDKMKGAGNLPAGTELFQMAEPTDTPEFKRWFGDSKVVDESGKPTIVYHGSPNDFNVFTYDKLGSNGTNEGFGFYFTDKKNIADGYAGEGRTAMQLYLNIEKPLSIDSKVMTKQQLTKFIRTLDPNGQGYLSNWGDVSYEGYNNVLKKAVDAEYNGSTNDVDMISGIANAAPMGYEDVYRSLKSSIGYDGIVVNNPEWGNDPAYGKPQTIYVAFFPEQVKSVNNRGTWDPTDPNILFQDADPRMPLGGFDESAGWFPQSQAMNEVWSQEIQPLLDGMRDVAIENMNNPTMNDTYSRLSPAAQQQLNTYLKGVQQDMASTKMAAQRWGQDRRDFAMLNYNSRTGFDQWLDIAFPYQFFYTRSMMTWAARAIDNPAILSNYARLRMQQDRYENNLPERLRGKMRIDAPYLPDWMGDALYIDPLSVLFTPHNFLRPFEQMAKDNNMQYVEAERILQEWAADGTIPEAQITEAAQTRSGTTWERALAEAKMRREAQISNPMDFVSATFGPAWYLTTPAKLLGIGKDGAETVSELPITRTARAVDTVTQGSWAEPIGNLIGLLAKPEEKFREANNLPEFGEYGDYYIDRNIANMVAEGLITSEDAQIAMIERQGQIFEQARERTKMELAMRIPLMGATYAGLNSDNFFAGLGNFVKALPASLFGAGVLPEGELQYRGLKQEWNDAWKLRDAGDEQAITRFFNEHPEYEAYLAKGKEPEERLRSFLVGQIWDGYMALGTTDRKSATAEMGDEFKQSFLDSETRSYDTISIETLTQWAQMVKKKVPNTPQTLPAIQNPRTVDYLSPEVTKVTDQYFEQRNRLYPNYYELQTQYYNLPKSKRDSFLVANPQLSDYWAWNRKWKNRFPELTPVFTGQVFKRVDTSTWNPLLTQYVADYAYSGTPLGPGAYKALEQIWINEGMPRGDFETWLKSDVTPSFLYGQ